MNKILLVDIDTATANMFSDVIKMHSQTLETITASNVKEVPNLISRQKVGMIIIDLKMPDNEDLEFLVYMDRDYPKIPIIVMTAFGTPEIANRINSLESCNYYEKPIDVKEISDKIIEELDSSVGGQIHGIALSSFLQMSEMEKTTCKLKIKSGKETGYLYLLKGDLIAAEAGLLNGKDAAFEIISWEETTIEIEKTSVKKKKEINMPLMNILMEGLRLKDEKEAQAKEAGTSDQAAASDEIGKLELETPPEPDQENEEAEEPAEKEMEKTSPAAADPREKVPEAPKGKSNKVLPIFAGILILLILAGGGIFVWVKVIKPGQLKEAYEVVLEDVGKQTTLEEKQIILEDYVNSAASSTYKKQAQDKIKEIFNLIQERDYEILNQQIKALPLNEKYKTEASAIYKEYLDKFPDGSHAKEIKEKLAGISALIDESDFAQLQKIKTDDYEKRIAAYRTYMEDHPEGKHREEVQKLLSDMGEIYFRYLTKEVKVCDLQKEWRRCAGLFDEYISVYRNNRHIEQAIKIRDVMLTKDILFDLAQKAQAVKSDFSKMKNVYLDYLKANPKTPAKDGIIKELTGINEKIREKAAWDNIVKYCKNSGISIFDRVSKLEKYMGRNLEPKYRKGAEIIMKHLQEEKKEVVRRIKLEENQRKLEAERLATIEKEKARVKADKDRVAQKLEKISSRYSVRPDGTVTDKQTGLMWYILDTHLELRECLNFDDANAYVKNLDVGGHRDWRLPTTNDLLVILNNAPAFPSTGAKWYWTSELYWKGYFEFGRTVNRKGENIWVKGEAGLSDCGAVRAVRP